jgi:hypothetical protein
MTDQKPQDDNKKPGHGIGATLQTIAGAVFGIQSEKKRQEDFAKADPGKLIALGIITVVIIVIGMIVTVNSVLESAAK